MRNKRKNGAVKGKRTVAVCSPMSASGVTLTAAALACALAEDGGATFAELGGPYVFDAYGLARRFLLSGFSDLFSLWEKGEPLRGPENLWHGVRWAVRQGAFRPRTGPKTADDMLRFAERLPGAYTVLDCSGLADDVMDRVAAGCDRVYIVVDPLPGKLIPAAPRLQRMRYALPGAVLAVNRFSKGVRKRDLDEYLGTPDYLCLPDLGTEVTCRAEYACVLPWDLPEGKAFLDALKNRG